jgi:hypothetical protein
MVIINEAYVQKVFQSCEGNATNYKFAVLLQRIQEDIFGLENSYSLDKWFNFLSELGDMEFRVADIRDILNRISQNTKNPQIRKDILRITENIQIVYFTIISQKY